MTPLPSSDLDETTETVDLTQPVEGDNCFSLSGNLDEMVDWSQPARGYLGDPTYENSCLRQSHLMVEGTNLIGP